MESYIVLISFCRPLFALLWLILRSDRLPVMWPCSVHAVRAGRPQSMWPWPCPRLGQFSKCTPLCA